MATEVERIEMLLEDILEELECINAQLAARDWTSLRIMPMTPATQSETT